MPHALQELKQRVKTAVTLKWVAAELHMGAWSHVSNLLAAEKKTEPTTQTELNLCQ